jgi:hypothetical protein
LQLGSGKRGGEALLRFTGQVIAACICGEDWFLTGERTGTSREVTVFRTRHFLVIALTAFFHFTIVETTLRKTVLSVGSVAQMVSRDHVKTHQKEKPADKRYSASETFENIYLNLSSVPGRCRFADTGMGWKPANGETWTLEKDQISQGLWSRAAKGYELKIHTRNSGIVHLDGFAESVSSTCVEVWRLTSD